MLLRGRVRILGTILLLLWGTALYAGEQDLSQPEENFEAFWNGFDDHYALFDVKHIDWDAIYRVYRPRVTSKTRDEDLFEILGEMIGHLNDVHAYLRDPVNERTLRSGDLSESNWDIGEFSIDLIESKYGEGELISRVGGIFHFGWLKDRIGYFHFSAFTQAEESEQAVDEVIATLAGARAVIIDVRQNSGGDDKIGQIIVNRFAANRRLYMTVAERIPGKEHDAFEDPVSWYLEPAGPAQYTGPIVLLTNSHSVSAAENFALAARAIPRATIVGDITAGVMADSWNSTLPNGWKFSVPNNFFRDPNGVNWEGIGIPPDLEVTNRKEDIEEGRDRVLEFTIALINADGVRPWDRAAQVPAGKR